MNGEGGGEGSNSTSFTPSPDRERGPGGEVTALPAFDRQALEVLASGRISSVWGEAFRDQDGYVRQVRMPEPPLLLADRVTGIDAAPHSMAKGTIYTETDVTAGAWYLNEVGRMPAGVMIEAGQADLLLISWLGIDRLNRGERVYRLLGCELTYHGELPTPGETLRYDIHVDGHATQGDVRLFFFRYDCRVNGAMRLSVRHGQAGFFTDEELANSAGVLWDAPTGEHRTDGPLDPPAVASTPRELPPEALRSFADGRPADCFGPGWEVTRAHVRTPRITPGRMLFLERVTHLEPRGGPWGRGYLRAETPVTPEDWFFSGHFKNDPCMPGTLMFEGCLQAMAVYLAALGFTLDKDGCRFEPVMGEKIPMRCRGQVTPSSRLLVYEVFVESVQGGAEPTLFADLLVTVDGRKAFHARRAGLRVVPDWPLEHWAELGPGVLQESGDPVPVRAQAGLKGYQEPKPVVVVDGFALDYRALMASALGRPSRAFGPMYKPFDGPRRVARLPGPPYHFMSRVTALTAPVGVVTPGGTVEIEYDIPPSAWYFEQNGWRTMPFCVLLEAALQPCGWLASFVGSALTTETDLKFRNLDGTGTLTTDLLPTAGTLRTTVKITNISQSAGMIIESFDVACYLGDAQVYSLKTVFGFFPAEAFENQVGLPVSPAERERFEQPGNTLVDLRARPERYCAGSPRLAGPMLLMLDRVTTFVPDGGSKGLGYLRAEKDIDPAEWFFKAHFFQDPVQPGSLGLEALCQLVQFYMVERNIADGVPYVRFEPLMLARPLTWRYRGQVTPRNKRMTSECEITEVGRDARGPYVVANAWLWVDGKRIYSATGLGMRVVPGEPPADRWLWDHRPTFTVPAVPMMSMVDALGAAVKAREGALPSVFSDVQVHRWLPAPDGLPRLRTEVTEAGDALRVTLSAWREAGDRALSRFEPVATATARVGDPGPRPEVFSVLPDAREEPDPYASGALIHGPAFQHLVSLKVALSGSTATLDLGRGSVPRGAYHQGLLDALTHGIPHDGLWRWSREISEDRVAYPYRVKDLRFFEPVPERGMALVEARFAGFDGEPRFPMIDLQLVQDGRVLVALRLVEVLLPKGAFGMAPPAERRAFLRDRRWVPGLSLARCEPQETTLTEGAVRGMDWLPGTVAGAYGVPSERARDLVAQVAVKDHVARRACVHPSAVAVSEDLTTARASMRPLRVHPVAVTRAADGVTVRDAGPPAQDLGAVRAYWRARIGVGPWPVEDLYYGLIARFVRDVVLTDPEALERVRGRSCLYLGNHQVGVESLLFSVLASALSGTPTVTLAKAEHRTSWLGTLIAHNFSYPGVTDPDVIRFFDRDDRESLVKIVQDLALQMRTTGKNVMVHVEGTRSLTCRAPVVKMSSAFIDMALAVRAPIVPVRFVGGLPAEPLETRLEFPLGHGQQDYWIGAPLLPEDLEALPYKQRKELVLAAINGLGPPQEAEAPYPGDRELAAAAEAWRRASGCSPEHATLHATLASLPAPHPEVLAALAVARGERPEGVPEERLRWVTELGRRMRG